MSIQDTKPNIIGLCGLIGSGKDTVANHLVNKHGFYKYSWAKPLKDITSSLFGWDRQMVDGDTVENRQLRENKDEWWSKKLNREWSPRIAMQILGTEVMRNSLHSDIWVLAGQQEILKHKNVVIPDTRFPNEIAAIREMGGQIWHVKRGYYPLWWTELTKWKVENPYYTDNELGIYMGTEHANVHASEYSWHGSTFDAIIYNDSSIENLNRTTDSVIWNKV